MANSITTIPRFLLPHIPQSTRYIQHAAIGKAVAARARGLHSASSEWAPRTLSTHHRSHITIPQWQRCPQSRIGTEVAARRGFSTTAPQFRDHHFDTLKFVQRLKGEGFTEEQAVAMLKVLSDVIEESIQNLTRTMVPREDQERTTYTQKVDFAKLRSELMTADSTESSLTRGSHERLTNEIAKLNSRLRDDIQRTQASVRLDLNLEKGRIREEANVQELKLKETETRIEQETATLRERLEGVKFSTLQWLMGVCTGTAALMLGVWRLLM
ncbi:DUF1640-domain-containing protein [Massarina eburnea CBS 473.64]|uniref:DUF1640-domain-containing protein n=1 Tax=Massarina eburnea CBS 473.64 TaxID=1395130 RepID=A0A6A6SFE2_9PLEO|nr:DUF1640-domain-containing protein [Massarina eburnea CBS 473.64]